MNFAKFIKTSFDGKPPVAASASYVYLRILENFLEHLFYRAPLGNCLFHVQVAEFQPPDTIKRISQVLLKHFIQKRDLAIRRRSLT